MIRFIDEHRDQFGVEAICCILSATERGFITSRGYRAARTRPPSARARRDVLLLEEVKQIHAENYSVYGVRKMHHAMVRAGWQVGRDQVARLMRAAGLQGVRRGRKPITTRPAGEPDARPDLVERRFAAERVLTSCGSLTSPTSARSPGSATSRSSPTCTPARSWGGPCPPASILRGCRCSLWSTRC